MYNRIKAKYFSAPLLMEQSEVDKYLSILSSKEGEVYAKYDAQVQEATDSNIPYGASYHEETRVGVINISGPLTYKSTGMEMLCGDGGMSSYQSIETAFQQIAEMGAKIITTMGDTPGGEAYACFETGKNLRAIADAYGVKWIAYNDGTVASAGYALLCPADEIIVNPASETGSIGVVATLLNKNGELSQKGHERTFVYAGENKIPYDAEGNFRKEYIDDVQMKVNLLYMQFVNHVSQFRPMSENEVRGTKASMFIAEEALLNHLADKMMTRIEFADYLSKMSEELIALERNPQERKPMNFFESFLGKRKEASADVASIESLQAEYAQFAEQAAIKVDALNDEIAKAQASADAWKQKYEAAVAEQAKAKADSRLTQLTSLFGDEKGKSLHASLSKLSDTDYAAIVEATKALQDNVDSKLEAVAGIDAENKETKNLGEISGTAKILRERFAKQ